MMNRKRRLAASKETMKTALKFVLEGNSVQSACRKFKMSYYTLRNYCIMHNIKRGTIKSLRRLKDEDEVFNSEQESELVEMIKYCEGLFHGLDEFECRLIVYEMACTYKFNVEMPEIWKQNSCADLEWLKAFTKRHKDEIKMAKQRRCGPHVNVAPVLKQYFNTFYDNLEQIFFKNPQCRDPSRIFCMGETHTNIKPGEKSNANRDSSNDLITTCCFVNATGSSLPPVNIYPSKFSINTAYPPGTQSLSAPKGQLFRNDFVKVVQHFVNQSSSSPENPSILIMDSYIYHLSVPALLLAKKSGVHLATVHAHSCEHLLPLAAGIIDLLKGYISTSIDSWLVYNCAEGGSKNDHVIDYDIGKLIGEAYEKAMTPEKIIFAFQKCGVYPFDRDLFSDDNLESNIRQYPCPDCKVRSGFSKLEPFQYKIHREKDSAEEESEVIDQELPLEIENVADSAQNSSSNSETTKKIIYRKKLKMPRAESGLELDKLKRRMIRTVARLKKEKKTEEEVWEELTKESGNNCKKLWDRMRSLTLKKLKRLQEADDRVDNVPVVARMTLTDWLFYDMIIVHEKIDPIDEEELMSSSVLTKLLSLVQLFEIEGAYGDNLAESWTSATLYYNSNGYQCSPMMLQRRWYQLKKVTRDKFYNFWFTYRGNTRLLPLAAKAAPTELQREVALKFPYVITDAFLEWEEMIQRRLVIMPEEFQEKLRSMQGQSSVKPTKHENVPDLILIEPKVDTIYLGDSDSEPEELKEDEPHAPVTEEQVEQQTPVIVQVKTEPQDTIDVEQEQAPSFYDKIERYIQNEENRLGGELNKGTPESPNKEDASEIQAQSAFAIENQINDVSDVVDLDTNTQESIMIDDEDDEVMQTDENIEANDIRDDNDDEVIQTDENIEGNGINDDDEIHTEENTDANNVQYNISNVTSETEHLPIITSIACGDEAKVKTEFKVEFTLDDQSSEDEGDIIMLKDQETSRSECSTNMDEIHNQVPLNNMDKINQGAPLTDMEEIPSNLNFADDGIEFADDGIEYYEEDDEEEIDREETQARTATVSNQVSPKFDLKLLMNPVVYTTKLDHMNVYKNRPIYDTIEERGEIENIIIESKPVSALSINVETAKENIQAEVQEEVLNDGQTDDLFHNIDASDHEDDDEVIDERMKVKLTSYLLQKPRNRSYHPIQICKNPDFNTRLKRINVGFFGYSRNRLFLKACKPMTIDVSKAFESKLINGTMYLKKSDQDVQIVRDEKVESMVSHSSVIPSAVAVQSLMPHDTTDVDKILQEELKKRMLERNKVISLPHISVVRQINEQLKKAEVAPIMAQDINKVEIPPKKQDDTIVIDDLKKIEITQSIEKTPVSIVARKNIDIENRVVSFSSETVTTNTELQSVPIPIIDNSQSKANKQRAKKKNKVYPRASWTTKPKFLDCIDNNEMLLTTDTLYKMLTALDPGCIKKIINLKEKNQSKKYAQKNVQKNEQQNEQKDEQKNEQKDEQKNEQNDERNITEEKNEKDERKTEQTNKQENEQSNVQANTANEEKSCETQEDFTCVKPRRQRSVKNRCCWSNHRIDKLKGKIKSYMKHLCCIENGCQCCCRDALRSYYLSQKRNEAFTSSKLREDNKSPDDCECPPLPTPSTSISIDDDLETQIKTDTSLEERSDTVEDNDKSDLAMQLDDSSNVCMYSKTGTEPLKRIQPKPLSALQDTKSPVGLRCSCKPNVSVDQLQRKLLIDASNECSVHKGPKTTRPRALPTRIKDSKIYIHRKDIGITDRPYYLGKNKILLTDTKKPAISETPMVLPDGVQVILLPDGTITYMVNPGVELTPTELDSMPIILNALQEQIKATGITLPVTPLQPNEVIDLDNENNTSGNINEEKGTDEQASDPSTEQMREITVQENDGLNTKVISDVQNSTVNDEQNASLAKISESTQDNSITTTNLTADHQSTDTHEIEPTPAVEEVPKIVDECAIDSPSEEMAQPKDSSVNLESESSTANAGTSRNLLSDLMEMSGIVEEDMAPMPEEPLPTVEPILQTIIPVPALASIGGAKTSISAKINNKLHELYPVTSFADLKYACDNGGHFFKLDLSTGVIVPINVCIQKTGQTKIPRKVTSTDVIDLTDDSGVAEATTRESSATPSGTIVTSEPTTSTKEITKHIRVIKPGQSMLKTYPNLLKLTRLGLKSTSITSARDLRRLPNALKPLKLLEAKRQHANFILRRNLKQSLVYARPLKRALNLNKIEAKIDLVDSDAPMEEEYLVDRSSDDSSDDEPLAKVAKRMRTTEADSNTSQNEVDERLDPEAQTEEIEEEYIEIDNETQSDNDDDSTEPRPTQLVLSGKAINEPILNSLIPQPSGNDEESQDDCILGV